MPIYEYQCGGCEAQFELLIRGKENPICPKCNGKKVVRQMSVIASPTSDNSGGACDPQKTLIGGG